MRVKNNGQRSITLNLDNQKITWKPGETQILSDKLASEVESATDIYPDLEVIYKLNMEVEAAFERYLGLQTAVQNSDGGWVFFASIRSEDVRDASTASSLNQFGTQPEVIKEIHEFGISDGNALLSIKNSLDHLVALHAETPFTPINRLFPDVTKALILVGKTGPLPFDAYYDLGVLGAKNEIDFYKAIQVWHDLGNGPNVNPPTGEITTILSGNAALVDAVTMAQAARRLVDRFNTIRAPYYNIVFSDMLSRCEFYNELKTELHDGEAISVFGLEVAKIVRDENWAIGIDLENYYCTIGSASAVRLFKMYESDDDFDTVIQESITVLKSQKVLTGPAVGWYGVATDYNDLNTFLSGNKEDQGHTLMAFLETNQLTEARSLAKLVLDNQSLTGQFVDFFDVNLGENYAQDGAGRMAQGLLRATKMNLI